MTSQAGEDGIIAHILSVIRPSEKACVEFGAWDGKYLSNCYALLQQPDWRGLLIEGDAEKFLDLVRNYSGKANVVLMNRFVHFEGSDSLDSILREEGYPESFAVLSIDIDGSDYHVWESLQRYRPEILVIEFNPTIPNDVVFIQDRSFEVNQGCSLLALIELGKKKGYELAACTANNAIFVGSEKFPQLSITDNSIDAMYQPAQDGRIFHGYDGYVHVVGMDRIMWRKRRVSSDDFQVIPEDERGYNGALKQGAVSPK